MAEALKAGKLPQEILQRFLDMDTNPFLAWLLRIGCALWRGSYCLALSLQLLVGAASREVAPHCW